MGRARDLGAWGETQACRFLEQQGYGIVARNYHSRYGEIDIIAEDESFLVFVEVKLRRDARYGPACAAVDRRKQEKLTKTALMYLAAHETDKQPRFDVVELYAKDGMETKPLPVRHLKNAFFAQMRDST